MNRIKPEIVETIVHGPHRPLTEAEIQAREISEYGRTLTDEERITLQLMNAIEGDAWAATQAGQQEYAQPMHLGVTTLHLALMNRNPHHPQIRQRVLQPSWPQRSR